MDSLSRLFSLSPDRNTAIVITASVLTTLAVVGVSRVVFPQQNKKTAIPSPRATVLPHLTEEQQSALAYPPDVFPGGRNVDSPYGTMRVYEWGPEEGRKVLLVHGITTPCISLGAVAHGLAAKGCRVMMFDLWGRGYSDCPSDLPHDVRLYSSEILIALTSSPLSWIGGPAGGFSIVGYSLGGGISAGFTSFFPSMVNSLVLLAPAGIIRPERLNARTKFLFSVGFVPERILESVIKSRLKAGPMVPPKKEEKATALDAVAAEMETGVDAKTLYASADTTPLSKSRPDITVASAVGWQVENHDGFITAFMSSMRFAPITGHESSWQRLGLRKDKTLIIAGLTDPVITHSELKEDAFDLIGKDKVEWRDINNGHDFPFQSTSEVLEYISEFWRL